MDWSCWSGLSCEDEDEVVDVEDGVEGRVLRTRRVSGRPGAEGALRVVVVCVCGCVGGGAMRRVFDMMAGC